MTGQTFHFKAATGFGAVVDGSVVSSSSEQVASDLVKQGLIPVRIWPEAPLKRSRSLKLVAATVGRLLGRFRHVFPSA